MTGTDNTHWHGAGFALAGFAVLALHDALIKSLVGYSVFQIIFFAVLFSLVPFSLYIATDGSQGNLRPVQPFWVLLRSGLMVGSAVFGFFAFRTLELAQAYALLFSIPVLVTLLAIPLLGERVRLIRGLAIVIGLSGVLIVLRPGEIELGAGHLAALLAALCGATSAVITRRIGASERSATLILYPVIANILFVGTMLVFVYRPMPIVDLGKMAAIGMLAMLGQLLIIRAYRAAQAAFVAPFQYSQMLWAVFYGYAWFGESPDRYVFAGAAVIILAGLMIIWRESTSGVSLNRPLLRTRNLRAFLAPPMKSSECESRRDDAP